MVIRVFEQVLKNGISAQLEGHLEEADRLYQQVLENDPKNADAWHLSGALAHILGNLVEARRKLEHALDLEKDFPEALNTLGNILKDQNEFTAALKAYDRAVEIGSDVGGVFANRGDVLRCIGNLDAAEADCRKAIELDAELAAGHGNLAAVLMDRKDWEGAHLELKKAIRLEPQEPVFSINLSRTLIELDKANDALNIAEIAISLCPDSADALNALGNAHYALLDYTLAESFYRKALLLNPEHADVHNNLGNTLAKKNRLDEAEKCFKLGLKLDPKRPEFLTNLGGVLQAQGKIDEAINKFDEALVIDPDYADGYWNRSLARLLTGNLVEGFADYEWRFKLPEFLSVKTDIPLWKGQSLAGKTILIKSEQGYGDTIQFSRYASMLSERGAKVLLETHKPLARLFEVMDGLDEVIVRGAKPIHADFQVPVMSLPHRFGTTLDTIPAEVPYLQVSSDPVFDFSSKSQTVIGIAWAGNPKHKNSWAANRSLEITSLNPLFDIPDISWVSLQVDQRHNEVANIHKNKNLYDMRDQIEDFADTATVIAGLDLVITVDTAVAHLAGALGKPVWILLSFAADWRWLLDRDDCPWYPTMKLFRQKAPGDWKSVISSVREALYSKKV